MSNAIRTLIRESERNGGTLTMKRYKEDTKYRRGASLYKSSMEKQHLFHMRHYKTKEEKAEQKVVSLQEQQKKNVSIWQKIKNLFKR